MAGNKGGLSEALARHRSDLVSRWSSLAAAGLRSRLSQAELEKDFEELLGEIITATASGELTDISVAAYDRVRAVVGELSRSRAQAGFSPSETALGLFALKEAFRGLPADTQDEAQALSDFVDRLGLLSFEAFVRAREQVITQQAEQLLELSTPVVKLWEGVVAVPLVGTLDSGRTQVVMEKLLQTLIDTGSTHAIIDITGVPAVDTQVAQHLLKTIQAARLMGATCLVSGIRPQIAQTIVALGIDFGDIETRASLADALAAALAASGVTVARGGRNG